MPFKKEFNSFQWALPDSLNIPPDEPRARLNFYHDTIILECLENGTITTRTVSAQDVSLAFLNELTLSSGVLPKNALWWSQARYGTEVALWEPPKVWLVAVQHSPDKPPERLRVPLPGLIFICQPGRPPRVFAAKHRPSSRKDTIYHAPVFNLFHDGRTCAGSHKFPESVAEIPKSFFTSFFSVEATFQGRSQKYPDDLLKLWRELNGEKKYPLEDLVHMGQVKDIMT